MATSWQTTSFSGVRFREHATRMHEGAKDRYYSIRCKRHGREVERGLGWASAGITPEKAVRALDELRQTLERHPGALPPARKIRPGVSFSRFWETSYFPHIVKTKAVSSVALERGMYENWLAPAFGQLALDRLTRDRLESLAADMLEADRSPRTVRYMLSIVSQIWKLALEKNFDLPENPGAHVSVTLPEPRPFRLASPEELRKILAALARHNRELYDAVVLTLFCGLSPGELFRLSWADVSLAQGTIVVQAGKAGRGRTVYLPAAVNELLAKRNWESFSRMGGMRLTDYVFPRKAELRHEWFSRSFERMALEQGWNTKGAPRRERLTLASFRHMYAVWLISGGIGLSVVADLMGHKTTSLLQRYARLAPSPGALCRSVLDREWKALDLG